MTRVDDAIADDSQTIGTPTPNTEVKIIDPESGDSVPVGIIGER